MKTLIVVLIIAAFLQTSVIPLDLVLLILICRTYIRADRANYYLAFGFGLLVGHLSLTPLGITGIAYLIFIAATQGLSTIRLAGNPLAIAPLSFVLLSAGALVTSVAASQTPDFSKVIIASILSLPLLYAVRLWEERFIIQKEIKLKL